MPYRILPAENQVALWFTAGGAGAQHLPPKHWKEVL